MNWIERIINKCKAYLNASHANNIADRAATLFQVKENNNELWLTYDGHYIAPFELITKEYTTDECIKLVMKLRDLYFKREV